MAGRTLLVPSRIRCALCGRTGQGSYLRSSTGDALCSSHPWCPHCRTAHLTPACEEQQQIVVSERDAMTRATAVLQDLRGLQIGLPDVPVGLVPGMPGPEEGRCVKSSGGTTRSRSARIEIKSGLGPTRFGHVIAHEHTHALLHLRGGPAVHPYVEEGLCELVAVVWLTNRGTRQEVLNDVWANPHPAYGEQMRRLVRLARRHGVHRVLDRVLKTGQPE
ncbi:protein DA1 [Gordonia sp. HS-NH1]|uniref:protein DA1 n=1 Tax=Gordonia sp. HS-NH1 TaxID=1435068 RepID=UPI0012E3051C